MRRNLLSVFFLAAGLICLGVLVKTLSSEPVPAVKVEESKGPAEVATDLANSDDSRSPASAGKRHMRKLESYYVQQDRKRFLAACLQFEARTPAVWKSIRRKFPELKEGSRYTPQWLQLSAIIEEGVAARAVASHGNVEKIVSKIQALRSKFVLKSRPSLN